MRRSKLEVYLDILNVLAQGKPARLTQIICRANLNCQVAKGSLGFLVKRNLAEERIAIGRRGKIRSVFAITRKGVEALQCFCELNKALPVFENGRNQPLLFLKAPMVMKAASERSLA